MNLSTSRKLNLIRKSFNSNSDFCCRNKKSKHLDKNLFFINNNKTNEKIKFKNLKQNTNTINRIKDNKFEDLIHLKIYLNKFKDLNNDISKNIFEILKNGICKRKPIKNIFFELLDLEIENNNNKIKKNEIEEIKKEFLDFKNKNNEINEIKKDILNFKNKINSIKITFDKGVNTHENFLDHNTKETNKSIEKISKNNINSNKKIGDSSILNSFKKDKIIEESIESSIIDKKNSNFEEEKKFYDKMNKELSYSFNRISFGDKKTNKFIKKNLNDSNNNIKETPKFGLKKPDISFNCEKYLNEIKENNIERKKRKTFNINNKSNLNKSSSFNLENNKKSKSFIDIRKLGDSRRENIESSKKEIDNRCDLNLNQKSKNKIYISKIKKDFKHFDHFDIDFTTRKKKF